MIFPETFEIAQLFARAGIRYWVFGGNGVELYVGRSIRPHEDIDFFVSSAQAQNAVHLLEGVGWVYSSGSLDTGDIFFERNGLIIDLVPINDSQNPPHTQGELEHIVWPSDFLVPYATQSETLTLRPGMHWVMKEIIREFYGLEQVRDKDLLDLDALRPILLEHL
jgi:hypothetical protein